MNLKCTLPLNGEYVSPGCLMPTGPRKIYCKFFFSHASCERGFSLRGHPDSSFILFGDPGKFLQRTKKSRSSAKSTGVLNYWAISPAPSLTSWPLLSLPAKQGKESIVLCLSPKLAYCSQIQVWPLVSRRVCAHRGHAADAGRFALASSASSLRAPSSGCCLSSNHDLSSISKSCRL